MSHERVSHKAGIGNPAASWDDAVLLLQPSEDADDLSYFHGVAFATAEFMRDADIDAVEFMASEIRSRK